MKLGVFMVVLGCLFLLSAGANTLLARILSLVPIFQAVVGVVLVVGGGIRIHRKHSQAVNI